MTNHEIEREAIRCIIQEVKERIRRRGISPSIIRQRAKQIYDKDQAKYNKIAESILNLQKTIDLHEEKIP